MPTITVKLPRVLAERLRRTVARRRSTTSAVVRGAIEALVAVDSENAEGSCYDLSSDLAGVVTGPVDLSSNRRRLKGYGR